MNIAWYTGFAVAAATLALLVAVAAVGPRRSLRRRKKSRRVRNRYEAAFLSGGPARVADAAVAELHRQGHIDVVPPGIVVVRKSRAPQGAVLRSVLDLAREADNSALTTLREAAMLSPAVQAIGDELARRGLLNAPSAARRAVHRWAEIQTMALLLSLPAALVIAFVLGIGPHGEGPLFLFLVTLWVLPGAVITRYCARWTRGTLTAAGSQALDEYTRVERDPRQGVQVALRGPSAVTDGGLRDLMVSAAAFAPLVIAPDPGSGTAPAAWCGNGHGSGSCGGAPASPSWSGESGGSSGGSGSSSCGGGATSSCGGGGSSCGGGGCGGGV
ncbi:TIGR04222 domain-containing membrane protein [Streptomyces sp. NPDC094448]|uniref:TIGR04222 domain-containing membrane protein n=1 Tax=Streptomyces sp. NPDC094448 TaxID=3366063 RepID=UPI00382F23E1